MSLPFPAEAVVEGGFDPFPFRGFAEGSVPLLYVSIDTVEGTVVLLPAPLLLLALLLLLLLFTAEFAFPSDLVVVVVGDVGEDAAD